MVVVVLTTPSVHAIEPPNVLNQYNSDGSIVRLTTTVDANAQQRRFVVDLRSTDHDKAITVLKHVQSLSDAPNGDAALADIDRDGIAELVERRFCGAGPNCSYTIFKIDPETTTATKFFEGGYANIETIGPYLVTTNRSSCCSWIHQIIQPPASMRAINAEDTIATITVTAPRNQGDPALCEIRTAQSNQWSTLIDQTPALRNLCETFGQRFAIRTPAPDQSIHQELTP